MVPVTAAILRDDRGRVLLTQRREKDARALKWEFPGGKLRDGESPEDCLKREIEEELGIQTEVGEIFHVVSHQYPERTILLMGYVCEWCGGEIHLRAHRSYRWVEPARLLTFDLAEADRPIARKLVQRTVESAQ
jgi:8-oxo-dGTP diphosphatase